VDAFFEMFSFEGRANRAWYFWHQLLDGFVITALVVMLVVTGVVTGNMSLILPAVGVLIAGVVAGAAVTVKRLHDLDRPAWHLIGLMVPLYNIYLGLVLLLKRGDYGFNDYGQDPLAPPTPVHYLEG
jgi:uncharacterized membrane protein YhaH (DUF805 family)